jgi:hypothetical protein
MAAMRARSVRKGFQTKVLGLQDVDIGQIEVYN